jgi:hypothetical protein
MSTPSYPRVTTLESRILGVAAPMRPPEMFAGGDYWFLKNPSYRFRNETADMRNYIVLRVGNEDDTRVLLRPSWNNPMLLALFDEHPMCFLTNNVIERMKEATLLTTHLDERKLHCTICGDCRGEDVCVVEGFNACKDKVASVAARDAKYRDAKCNVTNEDWEWLRGMFGFADLYDATDRRKVLRWCVEAVQLEQRAWDIGMVFFRFHAARKLCSADSLPYDTVRTTKTCRMHSAHLYER